MLVAVAALEAAIVIRPSPELNERLIELKVKAKAARLEVLLADGFNALKAGSFDAARKLYREAVALAPESKEARTGSCFEKIENMSFLVWLCTAAASYLEPGTWN